MTGTPKVWIGVLRVGLVLHGVRSLKERRRIVHSLRDKLRARFDISCHEVGDADVHQRAWLALVTVGGDAQVVQSVLDRVRSYVSGLGDLWIADLTAEVLPWHPGLLIGGE